MANGLDLQCCLPGSSKSAPMILIFASAMSADYSFEVKNIETWATAFFKHNNPSVAIVVRQLFCVVQDCQVWTEVPNQTFGMNQAKYCLFTGSVQSTDYFFCKLLDFFFAF